MILQQDITAYDRTNIYNMDIEILSNEYPRRIIELLNQQNKLKDNMSLLELGIGHGYSTETFSRMFSEHTVIDADKELIKKYRQHHSDSTVKFENTFFEEYETTKKYDIIVMGFILEHVDDPVAIIKKYERFLNEDGSIFMTVPNAASLHRRFAYEAGLLKDMTELSETDIRYGHKRYYTKETFVADILAAGLDLIRVEGIWLKPFTTSQIISLKLDQKIYEGMCKAAYNYPELSCSMLAEAVRKK